MGSLLARLTQKAFLVLKLIYCWVIISHSGVNVHLPAITESSPEPPTSQMHT